MKACIVLRMVTRGEKLKMRRLKLGLARQALGAAAGGISISTIWRIETDANANPNPATLAALTRALDETEARDA